MSDKIPHNAFVVVADGTGARFFRNSGQGQNVTLRADGELLPAHLGNDGPSGRRPPESKGQEIDEATFAKQLAHDLYLSSDVRRWFKQAIPVVERVTFL